jgi:hypothetical protein
MAMLRKAATLAVVASAGVMGTAGAASAYAGNDSGSAGGDNAANQTGLITVNALNNVNISPNLGCALDQTAPDLTAQGLVGLVPVGASLNHLLEHANLNVLANGNTTTDVYDDSCTSNQGSSQAGNNSHGSTGAGSNTSVHNTGNGAGSYNNGNGRCAGGLTGGTAIGGTACTTITGGPATGTTGTTTTPSAPPAAATTAHFAPTAAPIQMELAGKLAQTGADIGGPLAGGTGALLGGTALMLMARGRKRVA